MVPLEDKVNYLDSIKDKPKLISFYKFLMKESLKGFIIDNSIEIDRFYIGFLKCIQGEDHIGFSDLYNKFSKRKPSTDSVWIYNDVLLFTIICGVVKFNLKKDWIISVVNQRNNNSNIIYQSVNTTFNNLINNNYGSNDNLFEIVVVFLDLLNLPQLTKEILDKTYISIPKKEFLFNAKYDFLNLMALRAYDIIVVTKEISDSNELLDLREFKVTFEHRVKIIGNLFYVIIVVTLVIVNYYYIKTSEGFKEYLSDIDIIFGIFGFGLLVFIKRIRYYISWLLLKSFGYMKYFKFMEIPKVNQYE